MNVHDSTIENIYFDLTLEAILKRYGYDFRQYAQLSLKRRISEFIKNESLVDFSQLIDKILTDEKYFEKFLFQVNVNVSEMFRDPIFFVRLREKVIPLLRTYPSISIWHAGCSTGEEAYSLAILLKEENLLERAKIYATDINAVSIDFAKRGIYTLDKIKQYTQNYLKFNGKSDFSDYYHVKYGCAVINTSLRERINFVKHNLISDPMLRKFNLIFCRNVLIYFNKNLQNQVLDLLTDNLKHYAYLCLGMKENLCSMNVEDRFEVIDSKAKIYKKND